MKSLSFFGICVLSFTLFIPNVFAENENKALNDLYRLALSAQNSDFVNVSEIASIFQLGTNTTELQRETIKKNIVGKPVLCKLPVYEIKRDGNMFQVICSAGQFNTSFIIKLIAVDNSDVQRLIRFTTGSLIPIFGRLDDIFLRQIVITPAIIATPDSIDRLALKIGKEPPSSVSGKNQLSRIDMLYTLYKNNCYKDGPGCQGVDNSYSAEYMRTFYELEGKGIHMNQFEHLCKKACATDKFLSKDEFAQLTK